MGATSVPVPVSGKCTRTLLRRLPVEVTAHSSFAEASGRKILAAFYHIHHHLVQVWRRERRQVLLVEFPGLRVQVLLVHAVRGGEGRLRPRAVEFLGGLDLGLGHVGLDARENLAGLLEGHVRALHPESIDTRIVENLLGRRCALAARVAEVNAVLRHEKIC